MLKKGIKILKYIICCELAILMIIAVNACSSKSPVASSNNNTKSPVVMKSFGEISTAEVSNIEVYEIKIRKISFTKLNDGTKIVLWEGSHTVDLAGTSYNSTIPMKGDLPEASYKSVELTFENLIRVKGTLTINGTPYYTKASHTGHATAPAEIEELEYVKGISIHGIDKTFSPSIQLGGAITSIQLLVDLGGNLMYYTGVGDPPHPSITTGMNLYGMSTAVVVGAPGKVESYKISNVSTSNTPADTAGRYVFIFDGNDAVIGATTKFSFENGKRGMDLYANETLTVTKNEDGTLKIVMTGTLNGGPYTHTISSFTRATHTGSFTTVASWSGPGGTYTATKE